MYSERELDEEAVSELRSETSHILMPVHELRRLPTRDGTCCDDPSFESLEPGINAERSICPPTRDARRLLHRDPDRDGGSGYCRHGAIRAGRARAVRAAVLAVASQPRPCRARY